MTFWLNVGLCYLVLLGVGVAIGAWFGSRGRHDGGRGQSVLLPPDPVGPTLAMDCPPLGSAFDRALIPAAFTDEETLVAS